MISIKKRWDVGNNLLFHAITHGDTKDVIALLEDREAEVNCVNINGASPLHFAVYYQNFDIVKMLVHYGASLNAQEIAEIGRGTPLHRAVERNNFEISKFLLESGADPNLQDKNGFTALHVAARKGYADLVKLLIDRGVDIHKRDVFGNNASFWAKTGSFAKCLELLPPPATITGEALVEHRMVVREVHEVPAPKGKKKKKKKKK